RRLTRRTFDAPGVYDSDLVAGVDDISDVVHVPGVHCRRDGRTGNRQAETIFRTARTDLGVTFIRVVNALAHIVWEEGANVLAAERRNQVLVSILVEAHRARGGVL